MTTDRNERQARKLLALGLDEFGHHTEAANVRAGIDLDDYKVDLWAIRAALGSQPAAAPGIDLEQFRSAVIQACLRVHDEWQVGFVTTDEYLKAEKERDRLLALIDASPKGGENMHDWSLRMAKLEAGQHVGAGAHGIPDSPKVGSEARVSPWRPIAELPISDDLFWFARDDTIDGPRSPQAGGYDADEWNWFAPAEAPDFTPEMDAERDQLRAELNKAQATSAEAPVVPTQEMLDAGINSLLTFRKSGGDFTVHPSHAVQEVLKAALARTPAAPGIDPHALGLLKVLGAKDFAEASNIVGNLLADASPKGATLNEQFGSAEGLDSPKGGSEARAYTTGHCENHKKPGGCPLHNLQCGYPQCDRKPASDAEVRP